MRLPAFIQANTEAILVEWDAFARSIWPEGVQASPQELRDHAAEILQWIAGDMQTHQTLAQRLRKSRGDRGDDQDTARLDPAAKRHAVGRASSGMEMEAVVAEYRALRASVIRLWSESAPDPDAHDLDDLTRFNEAIDESLAEAVPRLYGASRPIPTDVSVGIGPRPAQPAECHRHLGASAAGPTR